MREEIKKRRREGRRGGIRKRGKKNIKERKNEQEKSKNKCGDRLGKAGEWLQRSYSSPWLPICCMIPHFA